MRPLLCHWDLNLGSKLVVTSVRSDLPIVQLDWHESFRLSNTKISAIPMCHWSTPLGWDRNKTLWSGFVVESATKTFLFPGDTGWFEGLHDLGKRYGPFDMAAIPIGAYEPRELMKTSHINPEEAVQMMDAVGAWQAVPIHWGCFTLALEPIMEPREHLVAAALQAKKDPPCFLHC
jgi:N-acyl-phosphatidylethanolamine-hydrolysing phospholipase D